jgi:hypothetical protein
MACAQQQIVEASLRIAHLCLSYRPLSGSSSEQSIPLGKISEESQTTTRLLRDYDPTNGETNLRDESSRTTTDSQETVQRLQLEYLFLKRVYREYIAKTCREPIPSKSNKNHFRKHRSPILPASVVADNHNNGSQSNNGTHKNTVDEEAQINQGLRVVRRQALSDMSEQVTQALALYGEWDAIYKPVRAATLLSAWYTCPPPRALSSRDTSRSGQNRTLESENGPIANIDALAAAAEPSKGSNKDQDSRREHQKRLARENVLLKGILADLVATYAPQFPLHWD